MSTLFHWDDVPEGEARGFEHQGFDLFAVKRDGELFVYRNRCPHLGVELNWMPDQFLEQGGDLIQCATHGALFLIDSGKCVSGPCVDEMLETVPHRVDDGQVSVDVSELRP